MWNIKTINFFSTTITNKIKTIRKIIVYFIFLIVYNVSKYSTLMNREWLNYQQIGYILINTIMVNFYFLIICNLIINGRPNGKVIRLCHFSEHNYSYTQVHTIMEDIFYRFQFLTNRNTAHLTEIKQLLW